MPKFIITIEDRYEVEAESAEQALASYRVVFEDGEPSLLGLTPDKIIEQDKFEFLDGQGKAEEA